MCVIVCVAAGVYLQACVCGCRCVCVCVAAVTFVSSLFVSTSLSRSKFPLSTLACSLHFRLGMNRPSTFHLPRPKIPSPFSFPFPQCECFLFTPFPMYKFLFSTPFASSLHFLRLLSLRTVSEVLDSPLSSPFPRNRTPLSPVSNLFHR